VVAIGRSILVIIWHLLANPDTRYTDLGSDFYADRVSPQRRRRDYVRQLEALGYTVILERAA
jgi:transposase